jgi:hypothetical protein
MKQKVTIDIDPYPAAWEINALRAYYGLQRLYGEVEVAISSSGKGIHLTAWTDADPGEVDHKEIRRNLCDDPNRIFLDKMRGKHGLETQVLWTGKSNREGEKERYVDCIHQAIRAVKSELRGSEYDQMRRLANRGHKGAPHISP